MCSFYHATTAIAQNPDEQLRAWRACDGPVLANDGVKLSAGNHFNKEEHRQAYLDWMLRMFTGEYVDSNSPDDIIFVQHGGNQLFAEGVRFGEGIGQIVAGAGGRFHFVEGVPTIILKNAAKPSKTCVPKDMCSQNRIEFHDF